MGAAGAMDTLEGAADVHGKGDRFIQILGWELRYYAAPPYL